MSLTVQETVGDIIGIVPCSHRLHDFKKTRLKPVRSSVETPHILGSVEIAWPLYCCCVFPPSRRLPLSTTPRLNRRFRNTGFRGRSSSSKTKFLPNRKIS